MSGDMVTEVAGPDPELLAGCQLVWSPGFRLGRRPPVKLESFSAGGGCAGGVLRVRSALAACPAVSRSPVEVSGPDAADC